MPLNPKLWGFKIRKKEKRSTQCINIKWQHFTLCQFCYLYIDFCAAMTTISTKHTHSFSSVLHYVLTNLKDQILKQFPLARWFFNCKLWSSSRGSLRVCLIVPKNSKQNPLKHSSFEWVVTVKMKRNPVVMCHHNKKQTVGCLI